MKLTHQDTALYDDAVTMSTHSGTHIDSLNHLGYGDKIFNGYEASRYLANKGWTMAPEGVHTYVFAERGVCLLELVWLEDLAKDKMYEFAFIAAPIKLRGSTGSPTRPLAFPLRAEKSE